MQLNMLLLTASLLAFAPLLLVPFSQYEAVVQILVCFCDYHNTTPFMMIFHTKYVENMSILPLNDKQCREMLINCHCYMFSHMLNAMSTGKACTKNMMGKD